MLNRTIVFLLLFPLLGAAGFVLRTLQLHTGFEPVTGLPVPGAAVPTAAAVCAILAAALLVSLSLPKTADGAPPVSQSMPPAAALCAAVLTALMGILLLMGHGNHVDTLLAVSALFTALFFLFSLYPGTGQGLHIFCEMERALFYTAFLIVYFSRHISDPTVAAFYPPLVALCAAALAFCELSGAACGRVRPRRLALFLSAGCALCLLAAADFCTRSGAPFACGLFAAAAAQYAIYCRVLFRSASCRK